MNEKKVDDGGPAFPMPGLSQLPNNQFMHGKLGMMLRDYLAAKALPALIGANIEVAKLGKTPSSHIEMAKAAYMYADAMLAARTAGSNG
jgi:hypothetical protein